MLGIDDISQGSVFGLQERRRSRHRYFLVHRAHFEHNVEACLLVYLKDRARKSRPSEAGFFNSDGVGSDGEKGCQIFSKVIGHELPFAARVLVRDRDLRLRNHPAAGVRDHA